MQGVSAAVVWQMVENKTPPLERTAVLPIFFLGAAELVSGITGL